MKCPCLSGKLEQYNAIAKRRWTSIVPPWLKQEKNWHFCGGHFKLSIETVWNLTLSDEGGLNMSHSAHVTLLVAACCMLLAFSSHFSKSRLSRWRLKMVVNFKMAINTIYQMAQYEHWIINMALPFCCVTQFQTYVKKKKKRKLRGNLILFLIAFITTGKNYHTAWMFTGVCASSKVWLGLLTWVHSFTALYCLMIK